MRSTRRRTWAAHGRLSGSGRMYDTLVNIQSGRACWAKHSHACVEAQASSAGFAFGLQQRLRRRSNNYAKLDFSKASSTILWRLPPRPPVLRLRLAGKPGQLRADGPYGMVNGVATAASLAWPQNNDSPVMFNTVRRMTDTNLTILPLSKVSFRAVLAEHLPGRHSGQPGRSANTIR